MKFALSSLPFLAWGILCLVIFMNNSAQNLILSAVISLIIATFLIVIGIIDAVLFYERKNSNDDQFD